MWTVNGRSTFIAYVQQWCVSIIIYISDNISDSLDRFRRYQTFLHTVMANTAAGTYDSMQIIEAKRMLDSLISAPSQYDRWLDGFSASVTARLTWGKHVETGGEEFFRTLHDISQTFEQVGDRGSKIYSRFPSLLLLPDWIAPLKRTARSLHMWETNFFKRLINETRLDMAAGATQPSFAWHFIQNKSSGLSETEGAHALGGVFEVASRMIAAQMKSFCLALCLYPEWQDKLQTEIDAICGDRVPEFADMQSLPVTRAILVEVTRWRPACPVGVYTPTRALHLFCSHSPSGSSVLPVTDALARSPPCSLPRRHVRWLPLQERYHLPPQHLGHDAQPLSLPVAQHF